jgi:hypothetical protein
MCVCWIRPQVAEKENRCVGEDSWFDSRFIFSYTRRGVVPFLARTTFWRRTGLNTPTGAESAGDTIWISERGAGKVHSLPLPK